MKKCWKAEDGSIFNSERECVKYEKNEMVKNKIRDQLVTLMNNTKCPVVGYDHYKLEEWIADNKDDMLNILMGEGSRYD
jgi:dsDNA-binding SOS-regulon protein